MTDWGQLYRDNVAAVTAMANGLDAGQLATTVPATPTWTVHDVIAHLAGAPADAVTGRMEGAPSPEWTARHVNERAHRPVDELTAEMASNQDAVAASTVGNPRPAIAWDISVHHADLHEALGLGRPPERFWQPVLEGVAPMMLGKVEATITCGDASYGAGGGPVEVSPYELYRSVFSRRSRSQMRVWAGSALAVEQLDGLCIFGPRDDDQPIPD